MAHYTRTTWIAKSRLSELRYKIRQCLNNAYREEGLAILKGVREGGYLLNLIKQDHPDRIGIVNWLIGKEEE